MSEWSFKEPALNIQPSNPTQTELTPIDESKIWKVSDLQKQARKQKQQIESEGYDADTAELIWAKIIERAEAGQLRKRTIWKKLYKDIAAELEKTTTGEGFWTKEQFNKQHTTIQNIILEHVEGNLEAARKIFSDIAERVEQQAIAKTKTWPELVRETAEKLGHGEEWLETQQNENTKFATQTEEYTKGQSHTIGNEYGMAHAKFTSGTFVEYYPFIYNKSVLIGQPELILTKALDRQKIRGLSKKQPETLEQPENQEQSETPEQSDSEENLLTDPKPYLKAETRTFKAKSATKQQAQENDDAEISTAASLKMIPRGPAFWKCRMRAMQHNTRLGRNQIYREDWTEETIPEPEVLIFYVGVVHTTPGMIVDDVTYILKAAEQLPPGSPIFIGGDWYMQREGKKVYDKLENHETWAMGLVPGVTNYKPGKNAQMADQAVGNKAHTMIAPGIRLQPPQHMPHEGWRGIDIEEQTGARKTIDTAEEIKTLVGADHTAVAFQVLLSPEAIDYNKPRRQLIEELISPDKPNVEQQRRRVTQAVSAIFWNLERMGEKTPELKKKLMLAYAADILARYSPTFLAMEEMGAWWESFWSELSRVDLNILNAKHSQSADDDEYEEQLLKAEELKYTSESEQEEGATAKPRTPLLKRLRKEQEMLEEDDDERPVQVMSPPHWSQYDDDSYSDPNDTDYTSGQEFDIETDERWVQAASSEDMRLGENKWEWPEKEIIPTTPTISNAAPPKPQKKVEKRVRTVNKDREPKRLKRSPPQQKPTTSSNRQKKQPSSQQSSSSFHVDEYMIEDDSQPTIPVTHTPFYPGLQSPMQFPPLTAYANPNAITSFPSFPSMPRPSYSTFRTFPTPEELWSLLQAGKIRYGESVYVSEMQQYFRVINTSNGPTLMR